MTRFCRGLAPLICLFLCSNGVAQSTSWLRDAFPLDNRTHDFGTVARSAKTEYRFPIKNTSDKTIELGSIRTSCGCTTPTIETKKIAPGETGTILAKFNTGTFTGQKQATVTVTIVKPIYTEVQLTVRGYIRSDVVVAPGSAAFGEVVLGESKKLSLDVAYAGRSNWAIQEVKSDSPFISASIEEAGRQNGRIQYKLNVELKDNAPLGFFNGQLVLRTNDRRLTEVPVAISGDVRSAIQLSPTRLELGKIQPKSSISKRIVVKGKKPFRILGIRSDEIEVDFEPIEQSRKAHLVNLDLLAGELAAGNHSGKIWIKTDLQEDDLALDVDFALESVEIPTAKK